MIASAHGQSRRMPRTMARQASASRLSSPSSIHTTGLNFRAAASKSTTSHWSVNAAAAGCTTPSPSATTDAPSNTTAS